MPISDNRSSGGGGGGVTSVNGQTGVVSITAASLNVPTKILPAASQQVFVNQLVGNDVSGDGSFDRPYQTVVHALTQITDATINKPYHIMLQGRQVETADVFLKPYVFIVGEIQRKTYFRVNGGQIRPHADHSTSSAWCGLKNLYLGGSTGIEWDLQAIGGSDCIFVIEDCTTSGALNFQGRNAGGGDYLEMYGGLHIGAMNLDSMYFQIQSWEITGLVTCTNSTARAGMSGTMAHSTVYSGISSDDVDINLNFVAYPGTAGLTTLNTVVIESYAGLPPVARRTLSGGTTVNEYAEFGSTSVPIDPAVQAVCPDNTTTQVAIGTVAANEIYNLTWVLKLDVSGKEIGGQITLGYDSGVIFDEERTYDGLDLDGVTLSGFENAGNLGIDVAMAAVGENAKFRYTLVKVDSIV